MKKRIVYTLFFLMATGWLIADDLPFLRMTLHRKNTQLVQGLVSQKFSRGAGMSRSGFKCNYFIEVRDMPRECSGTSRISKEDYFSIDENDPITLMRLDSLCLAAIDIHTHIPPALQFLPAGMALLFAARGTNSSIYIPAAFRCMIFAGYARWVKSCCFN